MPIEPDQRDGVWYMTGLTNSQIPEEREARLGSYCFDAGNGHYVGFDDSFEDSLVAKAFYDPAVARGFDSRPYSYVGYIQFAEISFLGQAIPPSVYGGVFADRDLYASSQRPFAFVDFMGPAEAQIRQTATGLDPFFAFNGALTDGTLRTVPDDFFRHPIPNGSLWLPQVSSADQSLAASLFCEVPASRVTAGDVARFLSDDNREPVIFCTLEDLGNYEAYQIALAVLTQPGEPLEGISYEEMGARAVGPYVLLTLPDPENMAPTLCVSSQVVNGAGEVYVHLLDYDDLDAMEESADSALLNRMHDYLVREGWQDVDGMGETAMEVERAGRGRGGLEASPFGNLHGRRCLELWYRTIAFGRATRSTRATGPLRPLSGFTWSTVFEWDDDTRTLEPAAIRRPAPWAGNEWQEPLERYYAALQDATLSDATIDTTNFTRAAMRRDRFGGAAQKLAVV